ncbi:hypothetical protein [Rathayibacter sp. AY1E1]|uniref:hypothetical protein n=2 Tax=unclassified Rathayibacter TaxID=2609250 RepID=UPI0011B0E850|nr:hypothetical protein [Rathayibacter sp. AY1E1]
MDHVNEDTAEGPEEPPAVRRLITGLDQALGALPMEGIDWQNRNWTITQIVRILGTQGIDVEALIRHGMDSVVAVAIISAVVQGEEPLTSDLVDLKRWRELLRYSASETDGEPFDDAGSVTVNLKFSAGTIVDWIKNAPLEDILEFRPPTDEQRTRYALARRVSSDSVEAYRWLWERNVVAQLDRWLQSSLIREWRWQEAQISPDFTAEALVTKGPQRDVLAAEISNRIAFPKDQERDAADRLFWDLQEEAISFLAKGRYTEAGALFEFFTRLNPKDPRAINNLAFCTFLTDPASSLHLFERAQKSGYPNLAMSVYNQCACLVELARGGEAIMRAESYWQREFQEDLLGGWVWRRSDETWELTASVDPNIELAQLMVSVANDLSLYDRQEKWTSRAADLTTISSDDGQEE